MTKKNKQREIEYKSNKEGFLIYAWQEALSTIVIISMITLYCIVFLRHFKFKSPIKGPTSKINFLNEKGSRRDIKKPDGSRPTLAYARLSTVDLDRLEKGSYSKRVKFDLTIQQTIEGDFDEQGWKSFFRYLF